MLAPDLGRYHALADRRIPRNQPVVHRRAQRDPQHRARLLPGARGEPPLFHVGQHVAAAG
jgi:hypothetical protein